jgi:hypothetical protein
VVPGRFVSFTIDPTTTRCSGCGIRAPVLTERDWDFYSGDFSELLRTGIRRLSRFKGKPSAGGADAALATGAVGARRRLCDTG